MFDRKAYMKEYHRKQYLENKNLILENNYKYVTKNKEKVDAYKKLWYTDNKDKVLKSRKKKYDETSAEQKRRTHLKENYNLTIEEYNNIFDEQGGRCKICNRHQSEFKFALHVDHDHKTGKVRGLLCQNCNQGIGLFHDNPDVLIKASEYLKEYIR